MPEHRLIRSVTIATILTVAVSVQTSEAQTWRTATFARQVWSTEPIAVRIEYGLGRLTLRPADGRTLYRFEVRYDEDRFTPVSTFDEGAGTLRLGVGSRERSGTVRGARDGGTATIELTRLVPLALNLDFGAGTADLDLGGISLTNLQISTGASETTLRFSEPNPIRAERIQVSAGAASISVLGLGNARADRVVFEGGVGSTVLDFTGDGNHNSTAAVKMGMGSVTLRFPRELGVRIDRTAVLTRFTADGMTQRDGSFFSSNWDTAGRRLTVDVEAALGSVRVEWVD
jgi:hypothetical protein